MPLFCYVCDTCDKKCEKWFWVRDKIEAPKCCDIEMERDYHAEHTNHVPGGVFPYVTTNLTPDGSPVEVKSHAHLSQLCKQYGKVHRDDAAFTERYQDIEAKFDRDGRMKVRPIYKDGNGDGEKGRRWF